MDGDDQALVGEIVLVVERLTERFDRGRDHRRKPKRRRTIGLVYGVALTVLACLRSGTRADVAWIVEADGMPVTDWSDAVVFTPGGGRIGSMAGGALDGKLGDLAGRWSTGRLVDIEVTEIDALIDGLPVGRLRRCLLVPADDTPRGSPGSRLRPTADLPGEPARR